MRKNNLQKKQQKSSNSLENLFKKLFCLLLSELRSILFDKKNKGSERHGITDFRCHTDNTDTDTGSVDVFYYKLRLCRQSVGYCWRLFLLIFPKLRKSGVIILAALVVDPILCNGILKNLVGRTRPFDVNTSVSILINKPRDFSFSIRSYSRFFCGSSSTLLFRREKALEDITCGSCFDRVFKIVSLCALSNRYPWWNCGWYSGRLHRIPGCRLASDIHIASCRSGTITKCLICHDPGKDQS